MEFKREKLIKREIEIAAYLRNDFSLRHVEKKTGVSKKHLDAHLKNMMEKLKAADMKELIELLKALKH